MYTGDQSAFLRSFFSFYGHNTKKEHLQMLVLKSKEKMMKQ